jgi:hypothetical protein
MVPAICHSGCFMTAQTLPILPAEELIERRLRRQRALLLLVVAAGIVCRLAQYLANPSLWHDEALVALNVMDKSAAQLFGQLDYAQAAPPLFLLAERGLWLATHNPEYALRLVSLLCGIASMPIFAVLCWRLLPGAVAPWTAGFFAFSDKLIWHSAEVKPYSGDVFIAVLLLFVALAIKHGTPAVRFVWLSLVAAIALWFSFPAAIVFGGLSLTLLPQLWRRKGLAVWLACNALVVGSFLLLYLVTVRHQHNEYGSYLLQYWAEDFPDYSHPLFIPIWLVKELGRLCDHPYRSFGAIVAVLAICGIADLIARDHHRLLGACMWPMALAIAAAFAHQYPFNGDRLTVYLLPGIFLLCGAGTALLRERLPMQPLPWQKLWFVLALVIVGRGVGEASYRLFVPRSRSNIRPIVQYIREHRQPGEGLYLVGEPDAQKITADSYTSTLSRELLCYWRDPSPWHAGMPADLNKIPERRFWIAFTSLPRHKTQTLEPLLKRLQPIATEKELKVAPGFGGAAVLFERSQ